MSRLCLLVLAFFAGSANAGYYVVVTSLGTNASSIYGIKVQALSSCESTIGGAVQALLRTSSNLYALSSADQTVSGIGVTQGTNYAQYGVVMHYATCPAVVGGFPPAGTVSGVVDPSISEAGNAGGSGSTGGGYSCGGSVLCESFEVTTAAALFSFFFSFVFGLYLVAKNIGVILNAIKRW